MGVSMDLAPSERRVVACLTLDVVGSTDLVVRLGPDQLKAELGRAFADVRNIVELRGGKIEKFLGDGLLATFGVPLSHTDDSERALGAALESVAALEHRRAEGDSLHVRLGVETGEVLVERENRSRDQAHELVGACLNISTRLQEKAGSGQVYVGPTCHELTTDVAEFESMGALRLKGLGEVSAWRLVRLRAPHLTLRPSFVGRAEELLTLRSAFEGARQGHPTLLVIVGPPGQGKSRLSEEFVQTIRPDAELLSARCRPDDENGKENPLRQLLPAEESLSPGLSLRTRLEAMIPGERERERVREALVHSAGVEVIPRFLGMLIPAREGEFLQGWGRYLDGLSAARPVVVVIEDLHWADPSFIRLMDRLTESGSSRLLIVATARPEVVGIAELRPGPNHLRIDLGPLDPQATATLARSVGSSSDANIAHAEGNPLFVLELARAPGRSSPIPMTIQAAIGAHLDELAPDDRGLLGCASVVGETFGVRDVVLLSGRRPAEVAGALARLVHLRYVLQDGGEFRFHHRLVRDVVYGRMAVGERLRLHAVYAQEGSGTEDVETAAHHWWQALGVPDAEWVWKGQPEGATYRAQAFLAQMAASNRHFERASSDRALEVAGRAVKLAGIPEESAKAHELVADIYTMRGDGNDAWVEWQRILAVYQKAGIPTPLRVFTEMVKIPIWMWGIFRQLPRPDEVLALLDEGIRTARATGNALALADLLVNRTNFTGTADGLAEAVATLGSVADNSGVGSVLVQLAGVQSLQGDLESALKTCTRIDSLVQSGVQLDQHQMLLWRFGAFYHAGNLAGAEEIATRVQVLSADQSPHYKTHALGMLAVVRAARGKWSEVPALAQEARRLVSENPYRGFCLVGADAVAWGAIAAVLAKPDVPDWLTPTVSRMVPESPAVQASLLLLPYSMVGQDRYRQKARPAHRLDTGLWHRQIWDQFGVNVTIGLAILERWDELGPYIETLEMVAAHGGRLCRAVRDAVMEEKARQSKGTPRRHEGLRRMGYEGLSQLLSFRPHRSDTGSRSS